MISLSVPGGTRVQVWDCERGADAETMYVRLASVIKNYRYKYLYLYPKNPVYCYLYCISPARTRTIQLFRFLG